MTLTPSSMLASSAAVDAAITSRRSVRAFLPTQVPRATVDDILRVASRAPSGVNTQPWKVYVLTGAAKARLSARILAAHDVNAAAGSSGADVGEYEALLAKSPYGIAEIVAKAEAEHVGGKAVFVQPRVLAGQEVFEVGIAMDDYVRFVEYDLMQGEALAQN